MGRALNKNPQSRTKMPKKARHSDPTWHPKNKKHRVGGTRRNVVVDDKHPFKLWAKAVKQAKKELKIEKSFGVKKDTPLYNKAKAIHAKLKKQAAKKKS